MIKTKMEYNIFKIYVLLTLFMVSHSQTVRIGQESCKFINNIVNCTQWSQDLSIFPNLRDFLQFQFKYAKFIYKFKNFTVLTNFSFRNYSITALDLSQNQIEMIEKNAFDGIRDLLQLDLALNLLKDFECSIFLHGVEHLNLDCNKIEELKKAALEKCVNLELLSLSAN